MTTPTNPTARPWRVIVDGVAELNNQTQIIEDANGELIAYGHLSPEHAALIVKAVNERDGLLEALRSIVSATHYERGLLARQINGIAFAALAKATGDE